MKKYIFFDIDGTLVGEKNGEEYIPQSTLITLEKLKEKGHFVAIASGRNMANVETTAKKLNIQNIVSDGGNGCMYKGQLLHIDPLDHDLVLRLTQELLDKSIPFGIMIDPNDRNVYATSKMMNHRYFEKVSFFDQKRDESFDYTKHPAYKVMIGVHKGEEDLVETIDAHQIVRYFDDFLAFEPDDKYKGMCELVELDGGHKEDIIFFGDGLNDIPTFKKLKTTIAMGNACQELKDIAYFITKDLLDDGIEYACHYFNLI